jgi:hypothetical protein
MHIKRFNESIDNSKSKMKSIVDNALISKIGGNEYFNSIDSSIKLPQNIDMIQTIFDNMKNTYNFNLILTGGFGEWILYMIKKGKIKVPNNLILVNGSLRNKNNKLNKLTTGKDVDIIYKKHDLDNQNFLLFDDSYYSGSTKNSIDKYLKKYNSKIIKTYVLYDGNNKIDKNRLSLYRYYDYHNGSKLKINNLIKYLDLHKNNLPIDQIEKNIVNNKIQTIRQINIELNKLSMIYNNNNIIDLNNINRKEEKEFESLFINYKQLLKKKINNYEKF